MLSSETSARSPAHDHGHEDDGDHAQESAVVQQLAPVESFGEGFAGDGNLLAEGNRFRLVAVGERGGDGGDVVVGCCGLVAAVAEFVAGRLHF